jgi:putative endonuclease
MFKVYILYSKGFDKLYIGYTSSFRNRIESHNLFGKHDWTRSYRPWVLIHLEEFNTKQEAMKREKELKGGKGREFLRKEILSINY